MPVGRDTTTVASIMAIGFVTTSGAARQQRPPADLPTYGYRVQHVYPHDANAFTQGLQYVDGVLYEGTGLNGRSSIRKVKLETGDVLQRRDVPAQHFGEGITVWKTELIELTWQSGIAFVYDRDTFQEKRQFKYAGEGWGLTHDDTRIIMSDGSSSLRFLDPETLRETGRLPVKDAGTPVKDLNELEYVKGEILANIWKTERIARISPKTGQVTGWIDLSGLLDPHDKAGTDVLKGNYPVKTIAASGVHGISKSIEYHRTHAPLRRNTDQDEVGDTALFLVSSLSRGITGEVIHVDGGFHVMGMSVL